MDIKKKRQVVIVVVLAVAILLPLAVQRMFGIKPVIPGGLANIFFWIYFPSAQAAAFVRRFTESNILRYSVFGITYIVTYLFLGWIIARLVYLNKKALSESDTPSEPAQD